MAYIFVIGGRTPYLFFGVVFGCCGVSGVVGATSLADVVGAAVGFLLAGFLTMTRGVS